MSIPFIDLKTQQSFIRDRVDQRIKEVLDHGKYIMGPEVFELEEQLGTFCGANHVVSCSSGTDAVWLPMLAHGIGPGDAVFVPSYTFTATAEAVALAGATPVFVDVDYRYFNMEPASLERAIESISKNSELQPRAVIPVDLFGIPAPYKELKEISDKYNLAVVADAAQSFGGISEQGKVGTLASVTATSFFPAKPLGCYGDGGAIFCEDAEFAERLRSLRIHGRGGGGKYDNVRVGTNARLDTIQAAVLLEKLAIFPGEIQKRDAVASRYSNLLADVLKVPSVPEGSISAWAQYTVEVERRDEIAETLNADGIPIQIYYPKPLHVQAPYLESPVDPNGLPATEHLAKTLMSLPMHPYLTTDDQDTVVDALKAVISQ